MDRGVHPRRGRRPRELAFRTAIASEGGNRVTETAARLDLRDPANLEIARPFLASQAPWSSIAGGASKQAVLDRIASDGIVERSVTDVDDDSRGASLSLTGGWKFGIGGKKVKIHRTLVTATVRRGGVAGQRLDCLPAKG